MHRWSRQAASQSISSPAAFGESHGIDASAPGLVTSLGARACAGTQRSIMAYMGAA